MQRYDTTNLTVLAAFSGSMNEFLDALELPHTQRIRRNMWQRLSSRGIDTSHWERSTTVKYTNRMLAEAAAASLSYAATLRTLGVPVTGGQHAHLARRIRAAGIDTSHFLGQGHNRGRSLPGRDPSTIFMVWPPGSGRPRTHTLRKALLEANVPHVCALCSSGPEWRGNPLVLTIDHVNGDWLDNRLENLRFLCPNCHAQTATWCRRNDRARLAIAT
jgi:hypothetical protein